jgi:predicted trehalose synthase
MNRCAQLSLALALAGTLAALAPASASAQGFVGPAAPQQPATVAPDGQSLLRRFPQAALRGKIVFGMPPVITMNGVVTRMAPAYHVRGVNNLLVMSAQLDGLTATVNYTRDLEGHVLDVWILSPAEIARLWPVALEQAAAWSFNPDSQTWTKP